MTEENAISYEIMLIVDPAIGEDRTREEIEKIKKMITDAEGKITFEDFWGVRYLAYKIRRNEKGYYVVLNFNAAPTLIKELSDELTLDQTILRYLILKTPKNYEVVTLEDLEKEAEKFKKLKLQKQEVGQEPAPKAAKPAVKAEKPVVEKAPEVVVEEKEEEPVEEEVEEVEPIVEEIEEEVETEVEEEKEEEKPKKEKKLKLETSNLDDVDAKLKSIIDDPDISL